MAQFDFHFHLLFKHAISDDQDVHKNIDVRGFGGLLDKIFGGPFDSQSSPEMVKNSPLYFGVIGILAVEHAFVNEMLRFPGFRLEKALPISEQMIKDIKESKTTYKKLFDAQVAYTIKHVLHNQGKWNMQLLNRADPASTTTALADLESALQNPKGYTGTRWFALSIEGGHNLCEVPIKSGQFYKEPEETLRKLMDRTDVDFMAMNLCHLSFIPEMHLGGFAQGLNKNSQQAFRSDDFHPSAGLGITAMGKKVIKEALTRKDRPILIDVKHMSLYTRLQYYRYKDKLAESYPHVERLPIISSHTGFTFNTIEEYIGEKQYEPYLATDPTTGNAITRITPQERRVGRTDDWFNKTIYCNPWTISLFDEDILEIFRSNGLIGISLDQRVLGTENMFVDSRRGQTYEAEHLSREEYIKMFRDQQMPAAENIGDLFKKLTPPQKKERHSMLLALHLVHAVRVGKAAGIIGSTDDEDASPWDYLCIGSDFDGLINPINAVKDVTQIDRLRSELMKYLPQADKSLPFYVKERALQYDRNGNLDKRHMERMIEKVLVTNGLHFLKRFIQNEW
jgi:microsomal dipeptidase-like Zn-dependent dipeptidase